jgi:hypothetical protein
MRINPRSPLRTAVRALVLLPFVLVFFVGCGAKNTSTAFSSRGGGVVTVDPSYRLGECNRINYSTVNLTGQVGTYYNPSTHQYVETNLNLGLTSVPAEIYTSSSNIIQIFRWSQTASGRTTNQIPVKMYFVDKLTGAIAPPNGATVDRLTKSTLDAARATFGASWLNVSTTQFFDRTLVVLTGIEFQYQGISLAYYDTATGGTPIAKADVLIPPFYSNPRVYANAYPIAALYSLHPNYSQINSNATENDYFMLIEDICGELSGVGTRIPASNPEPLSIWRQIWNRITTSLVVMTSWF